MTQLPRVGLAVTDCRYNTDTRNTVPLSLTPTENAACGAEDGPTILAWMLLNSGRIKSSLSGVVVGR